MTTSYNPSQHFDQLASKYEDLIGLLTGDIARYVLSEHLPPIDSSTVIHDNACGTGLVTQYLQEMMATKSSGSGSISPQIEATDFVASVVEITRHKASRHGWKNVTASVMDAQSLTFPAAHFDLSITNFGIFFLPEPQRGADEIFRTLKPGGTAIVTTWKERRVMDTLKLAQKALRPDRDVLSAPWEVPWSQEKTLRDTLLRAGFQEDKLRIVERRTDVLVGPLMRDPGMIARSYPASVEGWSDEDKEKLGPTMLKIAREQHPEDDGAGGLISVAFIAIATK